MQPNKSSYTGRNFTAGKSEQSLKTGCCTQGEKILELRCHIPKFLCDVLKSNKLDNFPYRKISLRVKKVQSCNANRNNNNNMLNTHGF